MGKHTLEMLPLDNRANNNPHRGTVAQGGIGLGFPREWCVNVEDDVVSRAADEDVVRDLPLSTGSSYVAARSVVPELHKDASDGVHWYLPCSSTTPAGLCSWCDCAFTTRGGSGAQCPRCALWLSLIMW